MQDAACITTRYEYCHCGLRTQHVLFCELAVCLNVQRPARSGDGSSVLACAVPHTAGTRIKAWPKVYAARAVRGPCGRAVAGAWMASALGLPCIMFRRL